jgi:hypothetical protein
VGRWNAAGTEVARSGGMLITREYLRSRGACYTDDRIADLVPPEGVTPLDVCDAECVPAEDRLWVLLHTDFLSDRDLRLLACTWAERALAIVEEPDPRSLASMSVARRYVAGEATDDELGAARDVGRDAVGDARDAWAAWAAWDAARAAWADALADVRAVLVAVLTCAPLSGERKARNEKL